MDKVVYYFESSLNYVLSNEAIIIIMTTIFILKIKNLSTNIYYRALTNFVGTFFHELAHFCIALIFLKIPKKISVIPKREGDMHVYGSVSIDYEDYNLINRTPIALAPLIIYPLFVFNPYVKSEYFSFMGNSVYSRILFLYLIIVLIINAIPSKTDFKLAFSSSLIFWLLLIMGFYYQDYITLDEVKNKLIELFYFFKGQL